MRLISKFRRHFIGCSAKDSCVKCLSTVIAKSVVVDFGSSIVSQVCVGCFHCQSWFVGFVEIVSRL